jgi:tRNA (adenine57-N1/adenine58-N1)-methyltransferase
LANYIKPGKVITYEKDKKMRKIAEKNVRLSGLSKFIRIKNKDATKGISEKNVDLVSVDIQNPENVVKHAYKALKPGGWLVVYSPTIEEVIAVTKKIRKLNFSYIKTVENIVREWQTERTTRPRTMGIMHTGFLTFARKVSD